MPRIIKFEGRTYILPDDATDKEVAAIISGGGSVNITHKPYDPHRGIRLNDRPAPLQPAGVPEGETGDYMMGQASRGIRNLGTAMLPSITPYALAHPIATVVGGAAGGAVQQGVEALGDLTGHPGAGELGGDVAGAAAGILAPKIPAKSVVSAVKFLRHPKTAVSKLVMDAVLEGIGQGAKKGTEKVNPIQDVYSHPPQPQPHPLQPLDDNYQSDYWNNFKWQGAGAGPELSSGVRYPQPVVAQLPPLPKSFLDPYSNPEGITPRWGRTGYWDPTPFKYQGAGAGPELDSGIRPVPQKPVNPPAMNLDPYASPPVSADPYSRAVAPPPVEGVRSVGVGAGPELYPGIKPVKITGATSPIQPKTNAAVAAATHQAPVQSPIPPVGEAMSQNTVMSGPEAHRYAHAQAQAAELPGSPSGSRAGAHTALTAIAKAKYGKNAWHELAPTQMQEIGDWLLDINMQRAKAAGNVPPVK